MRNPDTLQEVVEGKVAEVGGKERFTLKLSRTVARYFEAVFRSISSGLGFGELLFLVIVFFMHRNYNGEFDRLKADLRQLHAGEKELISYKTTLLILFRQVYSSTCHFDD